MVPLGYYTALSGMLASVGGAPSLQWGVRCGVTISSPTLSHLKTARKSFKNRVSSVSDFVLFPLHLHPTPHPKLTLFSPSPPLPLPALHPPPLVGMAQNWFLRLGQGSVSISVWSPWSSSWPNKEWGVEPGLKPSSTLALTLP